MIDAVFLLNLMMASIPFEMQQIHLKNADPCVRLLSRVGEVGCSTSLGGAVAPVHAILSRDDLLQFLRSPPATGQIALALAGPLSGLGTLNSLHECLRDRLVAVLVLHTNIPSVADAAFLEPQVAWGARDGVAHNSRLPQTWYPRGTDLSRHRFPFGMALLEANESARVLAAFDRGSLGDAAPDSGTRPLMHMRYPMFAHRDSPTCLAAGSCLPLGGHSVWGTLQPRIASHSPPFPTKPVAMLVAAMDGAAFFHEHVPAADGTVSGLVALLAAVAAITQTPYLRQQVGELPAQLVFALFTGEAWDGLGSRRFVRDVHAFNCSRATAEPTVGVGRDGYRSDERSGNDDDGAGTSGSPGGLPSLMGCEWPFKKDVRFTKLRTAPLRSVLQIGAVGAKEGRGKFYVHTPLHASDAAVAKAVALFGPSQSQSVRAATAGLGLPPGPALSLLSEVAQMGLPRPNLVATLTDYDSQYLGGGRHGSRFDSLASLEPSSVCTAATLTAKAWWTAAGGIGEPSANCSLVHALLRCLLESDVCDLAASLGVNARLDSHYTGVFPMVAPTTSFVSQLLRHRLLQSACDGSEPCEAVVALHDAYSTAIEPDEETGVWTIVDSNASVWAESNWPAEMYTYIYPYGAHSVLEALGMLVFGGLNTLLTVAAVQIARKYHRTIYKRL
jgi:hypothetical protein